MRLKPICISVIWCFIVVLLHVRDMVRNKLLGKRSMFKRAVPLDVAPERRTQRFSPIFGPGDRFCELNFSFWELKFCLQAVRERNIKSGSQSFRVVQSPLVLPSRKCFASLRDKFLLVSQIKMIFICDTKRNLSHNEAKHRVTPRVVAS